MNEHRPDGEIGRRSRLKICRQQCRTGSSPVLGTIAWGVSSAGRALRWQRRGHGFEPRKLHHETHGARATWVVKTPRTESMRPSTPWRDGRAAEGNGFENRRTATYRGFESHSLRQRPEFERREKTGSRRRRWHCEAKAERIPISLREKLASCGRNPYDTRHGMDTWQSRSIAPGC